MTPTGKIVNRFQSRLKNKVHWSLSRVIKHSKNLNLFPYKAMIAPTDKIPLASNMEDLEELHRKHIDPLTGTIYWKKDVKELNPVT